MTDRNGQPWSDAEERELAALVQKMGPVDETAKKLGRTPIAIINKLKKLRRRSAGQASPYAVRRHGPAPDPGWNPARWPRKPPAR
jgi:hypothetical protein